jgi:hypothetical protein
MQEVARRLVGRSFVRLLITLGLACGAWLAVMTAGATIWWTARGLLLREIRPAVQHLAEIAALRIDGRQLAQVRQPADIDKQPFRDVHSVLERLRRDNPSVLYVYTLRKLPAEHAWEYVVDANPRDVDRNLDGVIADEERGSPPGAPLNDAPFQQLASVFREQKPLADEDFISDPWGLSLSGYAPIPAPDGESYVVGIDVGNEPLVRLRNTLFVVVLLLGLILAGLIVGLRFRRAEVWGGFGERSLIE